VHPVGSYCTDICCHITILVTLFVETSGFESNLMFKDYHDSITRIILHRIQSNTIKLEISEAKWSMTLKVSLNLSVQVEATSKQALNSSTPLTTVP
jgi:hypothetical protein